MEPGEVTLECNGVECLKDNTKAVLEAIQPLRTRCRSNGQSRDMAKSAINKFKGILCMETAMLNINKQNDRWTMDDGRTTETSIVLQLVK